MNAFPWLLMAVAAFLVPPLLALAVGAVIFVVMLIVSIILSILAAIFLIFCLCSCLSGS